METPKESSVTEATRAAAAKHRAQVVGISERLVAQAEEALRRQLAKEPRNAGIWRRLADTQRMLGRFADAWESYRRAVALAPDPAVGWARTVLASAALPTPPAGERAVPFAQIRDFLSPEEQQGLWAETGASRYKPARVSKDRLDSSRRAAMVAKAPTVHAVRRWFVPKLRLALPEALARLNTDRRGLRAENVQKFGIELDLTAHHAGGYYTCHTDRNCDKHRTGGRRISYVYYFYRKPRRFSGGDLLLYDTDYYAGVTSMRAYSRLAAADNTLILFPSDSFHEITKVEPASGDTLAFGDGRFTLNGWIHERKLAPPPA